MSWISCSISCSFDVEFGYEDYIIDKNKVGSVFTVNPDAFVFPVDLVDDGVLQTWSKDFRRAVISLSGYSYKFEFFTVLMEL